MILLPLGSQLLQAFARGGPQAAVCPLLQAVSQDRDHQVAAKSWVRRLGEQFLPQRPQFMTLDAREFLDFGADFRGHASSPVRMTLPLYERWKSSETKAVADLAREHD